MRGHLRGHSRHCGAAAPPTPGTGTPSKLGCGPGTTRRGSGADNAGSWDAAGGGSRRAGERSEAAHSSPPARAPPPRPGGPRPQVPLLARPLLKSQKLARTPPTKLLSHRVAPGAPPRADSQQLRTFVAEKDNRRRPRLEAAAAEARSRHGGLGGARSFSTAAPAPCSS